LTLPEELQTAKVEWDDDAFQGTVLRVLRPVGVRGLLPPPNALKRMMDNGFQGLQLWGPEDRETVELSQDLFAGFKGLYRLWISNYKISNIHPLVFNGFGQLRELYLAQSLENRTFDLSILDGLNNLRELFFAFSSSLELTVSNVDKVPKSIWPILVPVSNFTKIDPVVEKIIYRKNSKTTLDLTDSTGIACDESVHWMAKYVLCPLDGLVIIGATCSNGMLLSKYLEQAVPDPCRFNSFKSDKGQMRSNMGFIKRSVLHPHLFSKK